MHLQLPNLDLTDFYHPVQNRKSASSAQHGQPIVLSMRNASFAVQSNNNSNNNEIKSSDGDCRPPKASAGDVDADESAALDDNAATTTTTSAEFSLFNISFQVVSVKLNWIGYLLGLNQCKFF